jgi:hypothetical protein
MLAVKAGRWPDTGLEPRADLHREPGRAVPNLIAAGNRAASVYANEAAIRYNRRALELLEAPGAPETTPETVAEIRENVGDLAALVGEVGEDIEAYKAAILQTCGSLRYETTRRTRRERGHSHVLQTGA